MVMGTLEAGEAGPTSAWSSLLSIGGLLSVVGTLGFSVVQMRSYEEQITLLENRLDSVVAEPVQGDDEAVAEPEGIAVEPVQTPVVQDSGPPASTVPSNDRRVAELEAQLEQMEEALGAARTDLADARSMIAALNSRLQTCGQQVGGSNSQVQQLAQNNALLERQIASLTQQNDRLTRENTALTQRNDRTSQQNTALTQRIDDLSERNSALTQRNSSLTQENSRLTELNNRFARENRELAQNCPPNPRATVIR